MSPEAKRPVAIVTLVAIVGILGQVLFGVFWFGTTVTAIEKDLENKAWRTELDGKLDESKLYEARLELTKGINALGKDYALHKEAQARTEGALVEALGGIRSDIREIKMSLNHRSER